MKFLKSFSSLTYCNDGMLKKIWMNIFFAICIFLHHSRFGISCEHIATNQSDQTESQEKNFNVENGSYLSQ